jgi:hypothetical protein
LRVCFFSHNTLPLFIFPLVIFYKCKPLPEGAGACTWKTEEGEGVMENENRAQECCMIKYCVWILCVKKCGNSARCLICVCLKFGFTMLGFVVVFEAWGYDARIVLMC